MKDIDIHAGIIVEFLNHRGFDVYYDQQVERIYLNGFGEMLVYFDVFPEDWEIVDPFFWEEILFKRLQLHIKNCHCCFNSHKCPFKVERKQDKFQVVQQAECQKLIEKNIFDNWRQVSGV